MNDQIRTSQSLSIKNQATARTLECVSEAISNYAPGHRSEHWDVFGEEYQKILNDPAAWSNCLNNALSVGLGLAGSRNENLVISDPRDRRLWASAYRQLCDLVGKEFVQKYHEARIGNPIHYPYDGVNIQPADLHLVYYAWQITNIYKGRGDGPKLIFEIGGGWGGLAAKLKKLYPDALIVLLDLPEMLPIQIHYLTEIFPEARIFDFLDLRAGRLNELQPGAFDFAFLPGWEISSLPDQSADLIINTRSMMEMNRAIVSYYFSEIHRLVKPDGIFYCVNRYEKDKVDLPIRIKEFDFDDHWYFCVDQPVWDRGPSVHELAAVRTRFANTYPPLVQMKGLPPLGWGDVAASFANFLGVLSALSGHLWGSTKHYLWKFTYLGPRNIVARMFPGLFEFFRKSIHGG